MKSHRCAPVFGSIFLLLTSCAHMSDMNQPADKAAYELGVVDAPNKDRFDITLRSHVDRKLCLTRDQWPSKAGQLHMGSDRAQLEVGDKRLPAADANFGYCPGGCEVFEIPPHGNLSGFIAYEAFGSTAEIKREKNRRLNFSVAPYFCR